MRRILATSACGALLAIAPAAWAQTDLVIGAGAATGPSTVVPGLTLFTFEVKVGINGPGDPAATVLVPLTFCQAPTWTCTASGGSTCTASGSGDIVDTANVTAGTGSVRLTYLAQCPVKSSVTPPLQPSMAVASSIGDSNPIDNSSAFNLTVTPQADLSITNTDGVTQATPGGSVTYTITASNAGPSDAPGSVVADAFASALAATWTCVGAGGGTCTASGSGNINDTVSLPAGGSVTYTASVTIDPIATGSLSNTATVSTSAGVTELNAGNNSATDTDTLAPQADLAITVTDGVTTATPGGSVTYTITASNAGPSDATFATVVDDFPPGSAITWTCVAAGGGFCTSGGGDIVDFVSLPAGGSVTYTANVMINPSSSGAYINTATIIVGSGYTDPNPGNNSATDIDALAASADLSITNTDGVTSAHPGGSVTYTITASNAGPSNATAARVADTFPASLTATWTCVGAGGGTCTASGAGNINDAVNLFPGASVTYTVSATISNSATGTLSNTATVTAPAGVTDPTPGNNSATDSDSLSIVSFSGPSATGTGTITANLSGPAGCSFVSPQFIGAPPGSPPVPPTAPPGNVIFPEGLFDFSVGGCGAGATITLSITYPQPLASGTRYWKYGPTASNHAPHWYVMPAAIAGNTATFSITDGGLGDDDLAANGTIVDQGGPGSSTTGVPTLDDRWVVLLMLLFVAGAARSMRRRGSEA